jgi:hypothetical protein
LYAHEIAGEKIRQAIFQKGRVSLGTGNVSLSEPESRELYRKRAASIERCFADMKEHRGLERFSRRGLTGAKTTIGLWVLLHNGLLWLREKTQNEMTTKNNPPPPDF